MMRNSMKTVALLSFWIIGALFLPAPAARAQSNGSLGARVANLERIQEKNNQDLARAINLLAQIQREFQSIRGQVEAANYLTQESDRVYRDLDMRVSGLEDNLDQVRRLFKEIVTNQKAGAPTKIPASNQEYEEYQGLLLLMNSRDYRAAASGFLGFLKKHPASPYAPNALFWAGESFYAMGDYARAIKEYQNLVDKYPQDERVKAAIYKQGMGFSRLNKNDQAKLFFQKVLAEYPNTAEAAKAQARLHYLSETEKNQVALGEGSQAPQPKEATPGEGSADRPITKISPYPKPKPAPEPSPEQAPNKETETTTPPSPSGGTKDSAPLF